VGLDENRFGTAKGKYYSVDYNTMVVDITHDRVYRVCASKNVSRVFEELKNIPVSCKHNSKLPQISSRRWMVYRFLESKPKLQILYQFKERLHGLYRTKGHHRASLAIENILVDLKAYEDDVDLKRLRFTLNRWKTEILNYFLTGFTNAMTEGFNNKAKLVRKMAYGYKNRNNYKIRLLNACFG